MVAYTSAQTTGPRLAPVSGVGLDGRSAHHERGTFTATVALTTADNVLMFYLPPRARVTGGYIKSTGQLDSNGTPTVTVNLGTLALPQLFFAASTNVGRIAGDSQETTLAPAGRDFQTTAKTPVYMTLQANPATGAATAVITAVLSYMVEQPA